MDFEGSAVAPQPGPARPGAYEGTCAGTLWHPALSLTPLGFFAVFGVIASLRLQVQSQGQGRARGDHRLAGALAWFQGFCGHNHAACLGLQGCWR
jgi:hypothetical protein